MGEMNAARRAPRNIPAGKELWRRVWKNRQAYLFLVPILVFLCIFKYYTFVTAIIESFFQWNGANVNEFIGFDNYLRLFADPAFHISMRNILAFMVSTIVISLTFPLFAAILVFSCRNKRISNFFRISYIVPMVVPTVVTLLMWKWLYSYDTGVINEILRSVGLDFLARAWLGDSDTALWAIIVIGFPYVGAYGLQFLVYLGGLLNIPLEVLESAELDGIRWRQLIFQIEIPLLKGQLKMFLMLSIINSLKIFENVLVLTEGGPGRSTLVPALYMYQQAFSYSNLGYASAIGVVLFVVIIILTIINYKYIKTEQ